MKAHLCQLKRSLPLLMPSRAIISHYPKPARRKTRYQKLRRMEFHKLWAIAETIKRKNFMSTNHTYPLVWQKDMLTIRARTKICTLFQLRKMQSSVLQVHKSWKKSECTTVGISHKLHPKQKKWIVKHTTALRKITSTMLSKATPARCLCTTNHSNWWIEDLTLPHGLSMNYSRTSLLTRHPTRLVVMDLQQKKHLSRESQFYLNSIRLKSLIWLRVMPLMLWDRRTCSRSWQSMKN